jgi:hypothetical protein
VSGLAAGGSGDPINDFLYPASGFQFQPASVRPEQQASGSGGVPGPGPSSPSAASDEALLRVVDDVIEGRAPLSAVDEALGCELTEEGDARWAWASDRGVVERARNAAQRAAASLPDPLYVLGVELRQMRRDLADWQQRDFVQREFQRQAKLVRKLAPLLRLMADSAEGTAASVHCTDAEDELWRAHWRDADPWGFELWRKARAALAEVGQ